MTKFVIEILQTINDDVSKASQFVGNRAIHFTLDYAFDKTKKFALPEGPAPYKPDAAPLGMSPANFSMETQRFYVFCRTDLHPVRRETLFVQLLEALHPSEAELLLAIKDQDLGRLFPNITLEVANAAGLTKIPPENAAVPPVKSEEKPRGKGRPAGAKNKTKDDGMDDTNKGNE